MIDPPLPDKPTTPRGPQASPSGDGEARTSAEHASSTPEVVAAPSEADKKKARKRVLRRRFLRGLVYGSLLLGAGYSYFVEPNWIRTVDRTWRVPTLGPAFDGLRIVQISDLHIDGSSTTLADLEALVARVNRLAPDVVVITGDFVDTHVTSEAAVRFGPTLGKLRAPLGKFGVTGNHDYWYDDYACAFVVAECAKAGVQLLRNDIARLTRGRDTLTIAGLDSAMVQRHTHLPRVIDLVDGVSPDQAGTWGTRLDTNAPREPQGEPALLLVHEPDVAEAVASTGRFFLQLSGHTHGGQVRAPFVEHPFYPRLGERFTIGHYVVEGGTSGRAMDLYTNVGIGTTGLAVRFGARPEITVHTLRRG